MVVDAGDGSLEAGRMSPVRALEAKKPSQATPKITIEAERAPRHHPERLRAWYAHIALISVAEFAAEASRGLVLPTLFSYCKALGGDLVFMGFLTSLFSGGRFVSSLLFGWLSDRVSFKTMYYVSAIFAILGNLLYILPHSPVIHSKTLLAVSRFLVGFGAGNRSVCRANIAALTRVDQRLQYFTMLATVVFLGYALTPGIGGVFGDIDVQIGIEYFQFNRFTAPGYILIILNLFTMAMNAYVYDPSITREDAPGPHAKATPRLDEAPVDSPALHQSSQQSTISDRMVAIGIVVFIFQNFNTRGILSVFETVNVPLYLRVIGQTNARSAEAVSTTTEAATFYFIVGLLGLVSYATVQVLRRRVSDERFLLFGFFVLMVGNALLLVLCVLMDSAEAPTETNFNLFVVAEIFVWSIGCPLTSAVVVSAFSKVLGTRPQGALMGLFGSSASIARMIMPFLPGVLPSWSWLFSVNMVLCGISMVILGLYLRHLRHNSLGTYSVVDTRSPALQA
ncbi:hypothetical protein Poli38472_005168 [Pythium oligandrum]|uniref:Major facilitator superfamily (MFS) profile domain-containing protein n=1 Tax=Pythium oligandrum TaxID=41045 RepID=A0A8K1FGA5_PYTOL|nr:hypothetical protein Poli38472_005168 [Pythium oligandrum]|eukprot:TMW62550.1 hypothetical protein Poli38472_005168 [Pythium oligandrum]